MTSSVPFLGPVHSDCSVSSSRRVQCLSDEATAEECDEVACCWELNTNAPTPIPPACFYGNYEGKTESCSRCKSLVVLSSVQISDSTNIAVVSYLSCI